MTEKRITAILYGCDRKLWSGGPLEICVTDLFASRKGKVVHNDKVDGAIVEIKLQLPFDAGQVYGVTVGSPDHRPAWQLIRRQDFIRSSGQVETDDVIRRLMIVPDTPGMTDLPDARQRLEESASPFAAPGTGLDESGFLALTPAAQMAFLNVEAKLRETIIDGASLLSFVKAVRHVAVDRVFVMFDAALKAKMARAADYAGAAGHGAPKGLSLPAHPDSWKHTRYGEGNVQLSFAKDAEPLPGDSTLAHSADVDIDLGRGIAHAKEWLVNNVFVPGHKTDQTLVYGLLYAQGILPQYTLDPAPPATTRSAPRPAAARGRTRGGANGSSRRRSAVRGTKKSAK